jgi:hypothetical protein
MQEVYPRLDINLQSIGNLRFGDMVNAPARVPTPNVCAYPDYAQSQSNF